MIYNTESVFFTSQIYCNDSSNTEVTPVAPATCATGKQVSWVVLGTVMHVK
jgi:hypothetical protein